MQCGERVPSAKPCWCFRPHASHVFSLADFGAAMRAKWSGEVIGGCVLHPQDGADVPRDREAVE